MWSSQAEEVPAEGGCIRVSLLHKRVWCVCFLIRLSVPVRERDGCTERERVRQREKEMVILQREKDRERETVGESELFLFTPPTLSLSHSHSFAQEHRTWALALQSSCRFERDTKGQRFRQSWNIYVSGALQPLYEMTLRRCHWQNKQ